MIHQDISFTSLRKAPCGIVSFGESFYPLQSDTQAHRKTRYTTSPFSSTARHNIINVKQELFSTGHSWFTDVI